MCTTQYAPQHFIIQTSLPQSVIYLNIVVLRQVLWYCNTKIYISYTTSMLVWRHCLVGFFVSFLLRIICECNGEHDGCLLKGQLKNGLSPKRSEGQIVFASRKTDFRPAMCELAEIEALTVAKLMAARRSEKLAKNISREGRARWISTREHCCTEYVLDSGQKILFRSRTLVYEIRQKWSRLSENPKKKKKKFKEI
jgi:hypothetical protein